MGDGVGVGGLVGGGVVGGVGVGFGDGLPVGPLVGLPVGLPVGVGCGDVGDFFGLGLCGDRVGCGVGRCLEVGDGEGEAECFRPCPRLWRDWPSAVGPDFLAECDLLGSTRMASL